MRIVCLTNIALWMFCTVIKIISWAPLTLNVNSASEKRNVSALINSTIMMPVRQDQKQRFRWKDVSFVGL